MQKRKLIKQGFGWAKEIGGMRQVMVRGIEKVDQMFALTMTAFNLTRNAHWDKSARKLHEGQEM